MQSWIGPGIGPGQAKDSAPEHEGVRIPLLTYAVVLDRVGLMGAVNQPSCRPARVVEAGHLDGGVGSLQVLLFGSGMP